MHIYLMLVLCAPAAPSCEVRWAQATYPSALHCESAARAVLDAPRALFDRYKGRELEGVFCEFAETPPKTYHINREELP